MVGCVLLDQVTCDVAVHARRGELNAHGHIALPMEVRNATTRLSLIGEDSAGAVQLLDKGASQRSA